MNKKKIGRPTKYNEEILKKTRAYIDTEYEPEGDLFPHVGGLSLYLKVRRETLHVWAKEKGKEKFSNMLRELKSKQERLLLKNSLNKKWNPAISKLVLSKHGYVEKSEQDITSGGEKVLNNEVILVMPKGKKK